MRKTVDRPRVTPQAGLMGGEITVEAVVCLCFGPTNHVSIGAIDARGETTASGDRAVAVACDLLMRRAF